MASRAFHSCILIDFDHRLRLATGANALNCTCFPMMPPVKDTQRALVRVGFDGRVHKTFRGPKAQERFDNEVRVLRYLERRGCDFVPRLLEADPQALKIVTSNCGRIVEQISEEKMKSVYDELEQYGVRHEDAVMRNITYRVTDGRFCAIDFEFATILDEKNSPPPPAS